MSYKEGREIEYLAFTNSVSKIKKRRRKLGLGIVLKHVPKSLQMVTAAMKLKGAYSLEGKL